MIIPVQTQFYAIKGLTALIKVINTIRVKLNHDLEILGLLATFYDGRTILAREMLENLRELGDHRVFNTMIKNTVKLGEAPLTGRPVTEYATELGGRPCIPGPGTGGHRTWLEATGLQRQHRVASSTRPPATEPDPGHRLR